MATFFDKNHKDRVGVALCKRMGKAVLDGELEGTEMPVVSKYILVVIDTIKTTEDLTAFLQKLSIRWPCFASVLAEEQKLLASVEKVEQKFVGRSHVI